MEFDGAANSGPSMFERRSLKGPITLGVVMIVLVVVLTVAWILVTIIAANKDFPAGFFWVLMAFGTVLLICVLGGVIAYLTLSVKAINLSRRQSNFIDSVTHELKSPIASLKLYLQTLTMREVDAEQRADFHRFMLDDVERLDQLINHLLDAGRIEKANLATGDDELLQLEDLLKSAAELTCLRYRLPSETVRLEVPETTLWSKQVQLEIMFRNLIDNAVKYGGSPPEVIVQAKQVENNQVLVKVIDNGAGIPANQRRKVFGRFVRLGSELERSRPGTGLGLYLVRNIARSLGGSVRVQDRKDGPGTEFKVLLPRLQGSAAESAEAPQEAMQ